MSKNKIDNNYISVTQQSGFKAGDEGFHINVTGHTDLKAGLIASTEKAAAANKNTFSTGTLSTSELHNQAQYKASSQSIGLGTSVTPGVPSPAGIGFGSDSDSQASTTQAGISQAHITITDDVKQKTKTGKNAAQTFAELNRNVSSDKDTSGALTNKFDATRVQNEIDAQTDITKTFGQQTAQAIGTFAQSKVKKYSDKATDLRKQAAHPDNNLSPDERQALFAQADQQTDEASKWSEGGSYRVALHTVAGGLVGHVAGAVAAGTVASAAPKLNDLQRDLTQSLKDAGASESVANLTSHLITQATVAGVGVAVGGATGNTTAGAAVGFNIDSNNRQLHPDLEFNYEVQF
jgi:filamentous hemagglutinin